MTGIGFALLWLCIDGSVIILHTANSIKVDIDYSQMCNMQQEKIMGLITVSHANVKIYHIY